jgi:cell division protein FtsW (lipid II flippase)
MSIFSRRYWLMILAPRGYRGNDPGTGSGRETYSGGLAKLVLFALFVWFCLWWQAVILEVQKAPQKWALETLTVRVKAGQTIDLGWRELGQKPGDTSAEEHHIRLTERGGGLWLYNVAQRRRLAITLEADGKSKNIGQRLETFGERFVIPREHVSRLALDGGSLTFHNVTERGFDLDVESAATSARRLYHYDGRSDGLSRTDGTAWDDACVEPDFVPGLLNAARRWLANALERLEGFAPAAVARFMRRSGELDIAALGGRFDCAEPNRKQIGGIGRLGWRSLKIVRTGTMFMVAPYDAATRSRHSVDFSVFAADGRPDPQASAHGFQQSGWRVDTGGSFGRLIELVAGKTTYRTTVGRQPDGSMNIRFMPVGTVTLFAANDCDTPEDRKACPSPFDTDLVSLQRLASAPIKPICAPEGTVCWEWLGQGNQLASLSQQQKVAGRTEMLAWRAIAALSALLIAGTLAGGPVIAFQRLVPALRKRAALAPYRTLRPLLLTSFSVVLALSPNLLGLAGIIIDPLTSLRLMLANWLFAGVVLLWGPSGVLLGLLWIAVTVLAALGSINLAEMAVDGDSTRWVTHFVKHRFMFLDFVPPLVIAVASCPPSALRPVLQAYVAGRSGWSRLAKFVPAMLLVIFFLAWFLVGGQTGLSFFQPVEAGKFATVLLIATALMALDPRLRGAGRGVALASAVIPIISVAGLGALLLAVPLFRSDWSPALIMILLFAGVLAAFGIVLVFRGLADQLDAHYQRQRSPRVFKPAFSRRWWLRRTWFYAFSFGSVVALGSWFAAGSPVATAFALVTGVQTWRGDIQGRLVDLESEGLGSARRVVVERIISWLDLDYERPQLASCSFQAGAVQAGVAPAGAARSDDQQPSVRRACYLDLEWQLIRSRRVLANARCGVAGFMRGEAGPPKTTAIFFEPINVVSRVVPAVLRGSRVCDAGSVNALAGAPSAQQKIMRPIDIPVVESDFAGAYLIGQLGATAAFLFYAAQALLLVVVAIGFVRVSMAASRGHVDEMVRRYTAIVLAGAAWLLILQWSLSWSNLLGLLPVMGQPMTWLSYATSHHLFMAVPCLLIFVIGLRYAGMYTYRYTPRDPPQFRYNRPDV